MSRSRNNNHSSNSDRIARRMQDHAAKVQARREIEMELLQANDIEPAVVAVDVIEKTTNGTVFRKIEMLVGLEIACCTITHRRSRSDHRRRKLLHARWEETKRRQANWDFLYRSWRQERGIDQDA